MAKTLIVWQMIPDEIRFYLVEADSEVATLANSCAGVLINSEDLGEDHPIFALSSLMEDLPYTDDSVIIEESIGKVISCGWIM